MVPSLHPLLLCLPAMVISQTFNPAICGTVFRDRCPDLVEKIICGSNACAQIAPYHAVLQFNIRNRAKREEEVERISVEDEITEVEPFCGGTLISDRHIVTAAHCLHSNRESRSICSVPRLVAEECRPNCPQGCHRVLASEIQVYIGLTKLLEASASHLHSVKKIHLNPGWNLQALDNDILEGHDVAVLELEKPVQLSDSVWPACLPEAADSFLITEDKPVTVVGFGMVNLTTKANSDILQMAEMKVSSDKACKSGSVWKVKGSQICALGETTKIAGCKVDSCQGDSGGGLIASRFGMRTLVGIVSFGEMLCGSGTNPRPGVYTNVLDHLPWILSIMENSKPINVEKGSLAEWGGWGAWSGCSTSCGPGFTRRNRLCVHSAVQAGERSGPHQAQCPGEETQLDTCNLQPCQAGNNPGLVNWFLDIIVPVIPGQRPPPLVLPGQRPPGSAPPSPGLPVPARPPLGLPEESSSVPSVCTTPETPEASADCRISCIGWPFKQCEVRLVEPDGFWQSATCLNPYFSKNSKLKYSNYPMCGKLPGGCARCDDVCAQRDGLKDRNGY